MVHLFADRYNYAGYSSPFGVRKTPAASRGTKQYKKAKAVNFSSHFDFEVFAEIVK
jgi:hypothetical protein